MNSRFTVEYEDLVIKKGQNDTSNSLDRNSVAGGIDNDFSNEQTTKSVNGGPGSGNFGHAGRPGEVGGSSKDGQGAGLVDKYPEVTDIAKRLAKKRPEGNLTDEYLDEVKKERKQLFEKYGEDKFRTDKKIQKWNDGWYMWGEKEEEDGGKIFSDIDIALSQAIVKECNDNTTVYRTQIDSNYNGEMLPSEHSSWTTSLTEAYRWGNFIGGVNSSIDLFETKVSPSNIVLVPDIMYSVTGLYPIQQQEYVLSNKTNLKASKRGMTWQEVRDEYEKLDNSASIQNGGAGSGNFGHSGRPGLVGGSGGGVGKFLFDGDLPSKNPQPTKEGYVVVHHNTDNETADAIAKEGLIAGKNLGAYQVSPEEGLGIWTDSRAKTDSSYGGCTISFQIPKEEYEKYAVNDTQHLIPHNIAREDIVCIDKIINENGSNGKAIKVSNLKDNVDYYTKKGLDENKVISIIAKNSHGIITEQEIKELVDFKKKVANGGPGSGNFGHAGRPGEVGGSAPSGMTIPNPASRIIRESDYNKPEFIARLKELGWTDEQIEAGRKRAIVGRLSKTILRKPDVEKFDTKIGPRLKELGVDDDTLKSLRDMVVKGAEKNKSTRTPEQAEAVDEFVNTGIILKASDEKFLRNNVPEEMVRILTEEVKNAKAEGLDIFRTRVQFTTAVKKGGSCTVDEFGNILVRLTKRDMSDLAMTTARNKRLGPNGEKWWTSEELAGTVRHELGHALAWQANKIHNGSNYSRYHSICSDIVTMANDRFTKATGATDWDTRHERRMDLRRNENYKYMSKYGQTNSMEVIAESYANPNYSEYTKEVVKSLQAYLKGEKLW